MSKILYVEDDPNLGFVTKDNLELEGYEIVHFQDGKEAWKSFSKEKYDLCLLDVMLPELDGFSLAEKIRKQNLQVPIIFLTAKTMQEDRITGLKIGGDDYVTKPFSIEELSLRIKIFLKRKDINKMHTEGLGNWEIGFYEFDYQQLTLKSSTKLEQLTHREAEVLKYLCERKNQVIKRDEILTAIWGRDDYFLGRSLDVFVTRLRKMLAEDSSIKIENVHGIGFRFAC
ncbi:Alkaline phosphatase synthesis transcriptional regulatory protein PhoP [Emticicia aquatica]|jgi:DNA-binding response OmpR family regulator|uniref:Alkaline phosphatase synthesis transcriptional regulatory protein PhoP n=1 Tax=Emticicia aquatica TaxID=1681835 RepID=A0ABM9AUE8_9BACT|nr:response regulator transcription factor [Emticicia aquatica]CAH0997323.1 Alkaline phosphatase synthesis transcriptional regulatory protein PhoP [Emticicia aquatica]